LLEKEYGKARAISSYRAGRIALDGTPEAIHQARLRFPFG